MVGATYPVVGALMVLVGRLDRGAELLARVLVGAGLASASAALTTALAMTAAVASDQARLWSQLQSFLWVPGFLPLLTLVPLLYPDGLLPGRIWRWAAGASMAGIVALSAGVALYDESLAGRVAVPKLVTAPAIAQALSFVAALLLVPSVLIALASLVVRHRFSRGLARRQMVVLLAAAAVLLVVTATQGLMPSPADVLVQAAAVVLLPLAIGVAVTRHRLYDLDLVVCRALVATSMAACLVGAYLSVFAVVQAISQDQSVLSAALAAGASGAVIQPLGRHLTAGVDRLYFGHRAEPYVVTSHLATRLTGAGADMAEVPDIVCSTVLADLRLRGARLWVDSDGGSTSRRVRGASRQRHLSPVPATTPRQHGRAPRGQPARRRATTTRTRPRGAAGRRRPGRARRSGAPSAPAPCNAVANRSWQPARPSDAGSAENCTTASAPASPVSGSRWRPRRPSRKTPRPPRC